jgi:hypothetical protein
VAVAAGAAGGAYALSSGSSAKDERQAFLNDVAGRLHVSPQHLRDAMKGALSDRLAAAVRSGRLTQAQADEIKRRTDAHGGPPLGGPGPGRPFFGGPPPFLGGPPPGPIFTGLDAAAKYLGLSDLQLRQQLRSGKSLAQIAGARNKPVDGLESAIEAGVKQRLDLAVENKRLTQSEEDRILSDLHARLGQIVRRTPPLRPRLRPPFRLHHRPW